MKAVHSPLRRHADILSSAELSWGDDSHTWENARQKLLQAVEPNLRAAVERLLARPRFGGAGIRAWADRIAAGATKLPDSVPTEVILVYVEHSEAMPHHDCAGCGMAIPVIPSRLDGEETPDCIFFAACPNCGGRTGPYLYWATSRLQGVKPR